MPQTPNPAAQKRYAAKDYDHPDVQYWVKTGGMLWWAAAALGLACMYDTLHQSLTFGAWPPYAPLYYLYYPILTAYAGARDKEKRVRRAQQYEKYTGEFFVYGWLAIAILIFFADSLGFGMSWPVNLYETLAVVWGVYLGVKFVVPLKWPIVPYDENNPNDPDAPPQPAPAPGPQPGPNPAPGPNDGPDEPGNGDGKSASGPILLQAYKNLGVFSIEDVVRETGLSLAVVKGHLGQMVRWGHVQKEPDGKFRWLG